MAIQKYAASIMAQATLLSPSLLRRWKLKYLNGLKDSYPKVDPQMRVLEEENERLNGTAHAADHR
jgi:hypothetical protein